MKPKKPTPPPTRTVCSGCSQVWNKGEESKCSCPPPILFAIIALLIMMVFWSPVIRFYLNN